MINTEDFDYARRSIRDTIHTRSIVPIHNEQELFDVESLLYQLSCMIYDSNILPVELYCKVYTLYWSM